MHSRVLTFDKPFNSQPNKEQKKHGLRQPSSIQERMQARREEVRVTVETKSWQ